MYIYLYIYVYIYIYIYIYTYIYISFWPTENKHNVIDTIKNITVEIKHCKV